MKQFTVKMKCLVYKTATFECESIEDAEGFALEYATRVTKSEMSDWEVLSVEENK